MKKLADVHIALPQPPSGVRVSYDESKDCLNIKFKRPTAGFGLLTVILYSVTLLAFLGIEMKYYPVYRLSCELWTHHIWLSPKDIAWIRISFWVGCFGLLSIPFAAICKLKRAVIEISESMIIARGLKTRKWKIENVKGISVSCGLAFATDIKPHSKATEVDTNRKYLNIHMTNLTKKECKWLNQVFMLILCI